MGYGSSLPRREPATVLTMSHDLDRGQRRVAARGAPTETRPFPCRVAAQFNQPLRGFR